MLKKIVRHYPKLRLALKAEGVHYAEIASEIHHSTAYVASVMSGSVSPRLSECYKMLEMIGADPSQIFEYFPADTTSTTSSARETNVRGDGSMQGQQAKTVIEISSKMEEISVMLRTLAGGL